MSLKSLIYLMAAMFNTATTAGHKHPVMIEGHRTHPVFKDDFSGHRFKNVYPDMNKRSTERKAKHQEYVANLAKLGVHWTPYGLYWMTHQLAEEHR